MAGRVQARRAHILATLLEVTQEQVRVGILLTGIGLDAALVRDVPGVALSATPPVWRDADKYEIEYCCHAPGGNQSQHPGSVSMTAVDRKVEFLEPRKEKRQAGRGTKLTLPRLERLVEVLMKGNYTVTACRYVGISESTFHSWRMRGEFELDRLTSGAEGLMIMESLEGDDPDTDRASIEHMWNHRPAKFKATEWPYVVFVFQTERAKAAAEISLVQGIQSAATGGDWRASSWMLERMYPDRFGRRERVSLEGVAGGSPMAVEHVVTVDELDVALSNLIELQKRKRRT